MNDAPLSLPSHCPLHPDEVVTAVCTACGRTFCRRCAGEIAGPLPDECPTCKMLETTGFLDAAEEIDFPDFF